MTRPRYACGLIFPDGDRWMIARGPSKCGPIRTKDPTWAETWETVEAVLEWLESIPESVLIKGEPVGGCRRWMNGIEFVAVPITPQVGPPVPLFKYEAPVLEAIHGRD